MDCLSINCTACISTVEIPRIPNPIMRPFPPFPHYPCYPHEATTMSIPRNKQTVTREYRSTTLPFPSRLDRRHRTPQTPFPSNPSLAGIPVGTALAVKGSLCSWRRRRQRRWHPRLPGTRSPSPSATAVRWAVPPRSTVLCGSRDSPILLFSVVDLLFMSFAGWLIRYGLGDLIEGNTTMLCSFG
jgi:hypothetical protein